VVDIKMNPYLFNNIYIVEAVNIYPGYGRRIFKRKTLLYFLYCLFLKIILVIIKYGYARYFKLLFPYMDKSSRRKAYSFRDLLYLDLHGNSYWFLAGVYAPL